MNSRPRIVLLAAAAVLLAGCLLVAGLDPAFVPWLWILIATSIVGGILVLASLSAWEGARFPRVLLGLVVAGGVVFRLLAMSAAPILSDDAARYHWDGKVLAHGVNPYRYAPNDPALDPLRTDALDGAINHPALHTVYPPLAQAIFALAYAASPGSLAGFHGATLLAELIAGWLLARHLKARGLPSSRLLLVAWFPLLVFEGYLPGHVDFLALPLLVAFVAGVDDSRPGRAGLFLGLACLIKPLPLLFLPAAIRAVGRRGAGRLVGATALTIALGYVPFLAAGRWLTDSMWLMATTWSFNGSLAAVLSAAIPAPAATMILGALLLGSVLAAARWGSDFHQRMLLAMLAFVICTTTLYPWYLVWMLPLLALRPDPALLTIALLAPLSNLVLIGNRADGSWILPPWVPVVEYAFFYGVLALSAIRGWGVFRREARA
ncbi:MAG: glycosyltransferase family 87 protein [Candidatus Eisenbacteria bacterium]